MSSAGEVFGFLGPNGAGKSTTIRLLLDLIRPTSGRAGLLGRDSRRDSVAARRSVGYLPGDLRLADRLTGPRRSSTRWSGCAERRRRSGTSSATRFGAVLDRPIRELSKGNRQKLGIVQAFMHRPPLLILDEPTSGLDPLLQEEFRALLRETAADGRTVVPLVAHARRGAARRRPRRDHPRRDGCSSVDRRRGRLRERALRHVTVVLGAAGGAPASPSIPGVRVQEQSDRARRASRPPRAPMNAVVKAAAGAEIADFVSSPADLEEIFLEAYREPDGD